MIIEKKLLKELLPRLEPDIPGAASVGLLAQGVEIDTQMSIAISLKRIADKLEQTSWPVENGEAFQILNRS